MTPIRAVAAGGPSRGSVLLLTPGVEGTGGAERSLIVAAPYYRDLGVRLTVAVFSDGPTNVAALEAAGAEVIDLADCRSHGELVLAVRRLLRGRRPDLLHTMHVDADVIGRIAAIGTGVPVMSSIAGMRAPVGRSDEWRQVLARRIDSLTARFACDHLHAVTPGVAAGVVRELGVRPERVSVVQRGRDGAALGVVSAERRAAARRRIGVAEGAPMLIAAGRHYPAKNHVLVVEVAGRLQRTRPDLVLAIAGADGPETEAIERVRAATPHPEQILLLGHRDDVADLIAAADVFVSPSLTEGAAGAVLEAFAIGTPVVATEAAGGLDGLVRPEVDLLQVPNSDPAEMQEAIERLLSDRELADRLTASAGELFDREFRLESNAPKLVELSLEVMRHEVAGRWGDPTMTKHESANALADTAEYYDSIAEDYTEQVGGLMEVESHLFERHVPKGSSVLDLGVGTGRTTAALLARSDDYVGLDISEGMVAQARRRFAGVDFRVGDAMRLEEFADGSLDVVVFSYNGIDTLQPLSGRMACLAEVRRVLRPAGVFIFSSHNARAFAKPLGVRRLREQGAVRSIAIWGYGTAKLAIHRMGHASFWRGEGYETDIAHGTPMYGVAAGRAARQLELMGFEVIERRGGEYPRHPPPFSEQLWYYACRPIAPT